MYARLPARRPALRRALADELGRFAAAPNTHAAVAPLLEVLETVIAGFGGARRAAHARLLTHVLLPLHRPNDFFGVARPALLLATYHAPLVRCVALYLEADAPRFAAPAIAAVLGAWPDGGRGANTSKEVLLLAELGALLKHVPVEPDAADALFARVAPELTRRVCECVRSDNWRLIEKALHLWSDEHFVALVGTQLALMLEPLLGALLRGGQPHWNPTVNRMTGPCSRGSRSSTRASRPRPRARSTAAASSPPRRRATRRAAAARPRPPRRPPPRRPPPPRPSWRRARRRRRRRRRRRTTTARTTRPPARRRRRPPRADADEKLPPPRSASARRRRRRRGVGRAAAPQDPVARCQPALDHRDDGQLAAARRGRPRARGAAPPVTVTAAAPGRGGRRRRRASRPSP